MDQQATKKTSAPATGVANIRIVVADDHPVVRFGVKNMLLNEPGFEVVGEAEDGDDAITQTLELEPDILLLDLAMPRLPGLEAMRAIMTKSPRVKIVLLTSTISTQQIIEALQIGARGIVLKDSVAGDLARPCAPSSAAITGSAASASPTCSRPCRNCRPRPPPSPSARPTASPRASSKSSPASSKAAATATSPSSSPSPRKR